VTVSWSANGNPAGTEYFVTNTTNGAESGWTTDTSTTFSNAGNSDFIFTIKARNTDGVETSNVQVSLSGGVGAVVVYGGGGGGGGSSNNNSQPVTTAPAPQKDNLIVKTQLESLTGPFSFGTTSSQVKILQKYLAQDPSIYPEGMITGFYGTLTKKAVARFQERYGLAKPGDDFYGLAGPQTRAKLATALGTNSVDNLPEDSVKLALIESLKKQITELTNRVAKLLEEKKTIVLCTVPTPTC
jgi:hypothetical protein